jgi:hypothetical protein
MSNKHDHPYGPWRRVEEDGVLGWRRDCTQEGCPYKCFTTVDPHSTDPFDRALHQMAGLEDQVREITWVEIAGLQVAAEKLICGECGILDLNVDVDTTGDVWVATCTEGHTWEFYPQESLA